MEDLRIYDGDFNLVSIENHFLSSYWTIKYNDVGSCEIHIDLKNPNLGALFSMPHMFIAQGDFQAYITGVQSGEDAVFYGRTLNYFLGGAVTKAFTEKVNDVETLSHSFVEDAAPHIMLGDKKVFTNKFSISRGSYVSTLQLVRDVLNLDNAGHRVYFDKREKKLVFECFKGEDNPLVISLKNKNAYSVSYSGDINSYYSGGWYLNKDDNMWKHISKDAGQGIFARDTVLLAGNESEAKTELSKMKRKVKAVSTVRGIAFGTDYNLGDVVRNVKSIGSFNETVPMRVTGVNKWYEANEMGEQPILEEA